VVAEIRSWTLPGVVVHHLDDLLWATGFERTDDPDGTDAVMAELVRRARTDQLATRVVLQRLLPGLSAVARRRRHRTGRRLPDEQLALLAAAWEVIRTYPIDRRPRRVAGNLMLDIEYQTYAREARLARTWRERPAADDDVRQRDDPGHERSHDLFHVLVDARRHGMAEADLALVLRSCDGATSAELADELGVSDRMVRYRRTAALRTLGELRERELLSV
jgi:hypothetical protein